ncbi:peptidyl-prolyl cis-trans isomerase FKBP4 isoform X2 [Lingula anatina]|uniref:peptidylprolyl isomerase n=1 Tax=Lingula anatina TaxID=7574 RepID=A0A1S3IZ45_LINAN|nr:peptidyl-prolyl cis-trans isomerase FKBP4 isoform X2 [Lingula anatina]|eukprot:XP_013403472.1 peptidyl-prolyl cis-trans isomerase FKBP4 isoform X2 [Lingula anatina]
MSDSLEESTPSSANAETMEVDGSGPQSESETNRPEISPNAVDLKDGGVFKEIKREGIGSETPCTGDEVYVHYTGKLVDGTVFDTSKTRDEFSFKLDRGSVIKAWDIALATMKVGEMAEVTCRPDFAYGDTGSPPKIPPNSWLIFEIELLGFMGEDVSTDKDGGVRKSVIVKGEGYKTPNDGAQVEMHIIGKCNGSVFEDKDLAFIVGDCQDEVVVEGVEMAVKKLKEGETARVKVQSKYAYGGEGSIKYGIPPNADLEYEMKMKKFEKAKESWEMDGKEKLDQSEVVKEKGTKFFKEGSYKKAITSYKRVISYLEYETDMEGEEKQKRDALMLAAYLNTAMCYLKLKDYVEARKHSDSALGIDVNSEKGYYRRGEANMGLNEFEDAKKDFSKVLEINPKNKAARDEQMRANKKIKEQNAKEKSIYQGMFKKFAEADSKGVKDKAVDGPGSGDQAKMETQSEGTAV